MVEEAEVDASRLMPCCHGDRIVRVDMEYHAPRGLHQGEQGGDLVESRPDAFAFEIEERNSSPRRNDPIRRHRFPLIDQDDCARLWVHEFHPPLSEPGMTSGLVGGGEDMERPPLDTRWIQPRPSAFQPGPLLECPFHA